jgi:hypothetical protein
MTHLEAKQKARELSRNMIFTFVVVQPYPSNGINDFKVMTYNKCKSEDNLKCYESYYDGHRVSY